MGFKANLGKQEFFETQIIDRTHPPVIVTMNAKENQGVLKLGLIIAKDENGLIVPYDPSASAPVNVPVGVVTVEIDTINETVTNILRHGCVIKDKLFTGVNRATEADLEKLRDILIFPL